MFIFLLGCVNFLFLLLLATIQITCNVKVGIVLEWVKGLKMSSLVHNSASWGTNSLKKFFNWVELWEIDEGNWAIDVMEENLHLW